MPLGLGRPRIRLVCSQSAPRVLRSDTKQLRGWLNNRLAHSHNILTGKEAADWDLECQLSIFVLDKARVDLVSRIVEQACKGLRVWVFAKKDLDPDFVHGFKRKFEPTNTQPIVTTWADLIDDGCKQIPPLLCELFHPELFLPPPVPTEQALFT